RPRFGPAAGKVGQLVQVGRFEEPVLPEGAHQIVERNSRHRHRGIERANPASAIVVPGRRGSKVSRRRENRCAAAVRATPAVELTGRLGYCADWRFSRITDRPHGNLLVPFRTLAWRNRWLPLKPRRRDLERARAPNGTTGSCSKPTAPT